MSNPPKRPAKEYPGIVRAYNQLRRAIKQMDDAAVDDATPEQLYELICTMHVYSTRCARDLLEVMLK